MEIDKPFYDREPEPGALVLAPVSAANLKKRIADAPEIAGCDTQAGIRDLEQNVLAIHPRADGHGAAPVAELNGIGDQVDQYLHDGTPVRDDIRQAARHVDVERESGLP